MLFLIILLLSLVLSGCFGTNIIIPKQDISAEDFAAEIGHGALWGRTDGEIDPLNGREIVLRPEADWNIPDGILEHYQTYFPKGKYHIYTHSMLDTSLSYYPDVALISGQYKLLFFFDGTKPYIEQDARPYPWIDAVESGGNFSYIINMKNSTSESDIRTYFYNLFYAIYHDDNFPYMVYYDDTCIFLMSNSVAFDTLYLKEFKKAEGHLYLFKN